MRKIGFDNEKYLNMQSEHIRERIAQFGGKLYMEFGGKLFDDYHASRVLPGFQPDSKLQMLLKLKEQAEIVIAVSAGAIDSNKRRGDIGITYDMEVLRLIDLFRSVGLYVGSVVVTQYNGQQSADAFIRRLQDMKIQAYRHYLIEGYPSNIPLIVSEDGYGKNDYVETSRSLIVVTAPGPGSGKMAVCLSQLYHEHQRGIQAGYAKFETFPIWNLALKHPVNVAYEAATADLKDVNMIDPFHLEAYNKVTVNYNRDVEIFPVLQAIFQKIYGSSPYKSPTDMGVNMAGNCIFDDEACKEASRQEILRRYYIALCEKKKGADKTEEVDKLKLLMNQEGLKAEDRIVACAARKKEEETGEPAAAMELPDGRIVIGRNKELLGAASAMLLNSLKELAGIPDEVDLLDSAVIKPVQELKVSYLGNQNPRLHTDEVLVALSVSAASNENAAKAMKCLPLLQDCDAHCSVILSPVDADIFRRLHINMTCEPKYQNNKLFHL
ncbi:MAG: DUF1846 domain-containing protein [Lachnospiraceae bacterium]|nr:DUF1846 domain-containing protein [Lachnospiraceae bacterium]